MSDDTKTASVTRSKATGSMAALEQVKIQLVLYRLQTLL